MPSRPLGRTMARSAPARCTRRTLSMPARALGISAFPIIPSRPPDLRTACAIVRSSSSGPSRGDSLPKPKPTHRTPAATRKSSSLSRSSRSTELSAAKGVTRIGIVPRSGGKLRPLEVEVLPLTLLGPFARTCPALSRFHFAVQPGIIGCTRDLLCAGPVVRIAEVGSCLNELGCPARTGPGQKQQARTRPERRLSRWRSGARGR